MTPVLDFQNGEGFVVTNESECEKNGAPPDKERETIKPFLLAVMNVCGPERYKAAGVLRKFVQSWQFVQFPEFHGSSARGNCAPPKNLPPPSISENWGRIWRNLSISCKTSIRMSCGRRWKKCHGAFPVFSGARAEETADGKIRLMFDDAHWPEPFSVGKMSDGTLRMLGILSLLHDPEPSPLLCVEEPEKEVYPHLLEELVEDFHRYTDRSGGHVLVSTHSYELLNAAAPEEVFLLEKRDGVTNIRCAGEDERIRRLIDRGDMMGRLWRMDKLMEPLE